MRLETILRKTQKELKSSLHKELSALGYNPKSRLGYLYAKGEVPVLLVAHLDTVHRFPVKHLCISKGGTILMSPEGIGGDDRAGVYMIMELVQKHKCHVLFCEEEEVGGIGARCFTLSKIKPDVNYIIELDRRGSRDAVFYDCDNPEFTSFVCGFGFVENSGSFSDISVIAPYLGVAAVNISAGYYDEHTRYEHINLTQVHRNIDILERMIGTETERFEYIECAPFIFGDYTSVMLSPLNPDGYLIAPKGDFVEAGDDVWVDACGRPYELFEDMGCAARLCGYRAVTSEGLPAKFDDDIAILFDVLPNEYA